MKLIDILNEVITEAAVTEDDIKVAIKSMNTAASAAGFIPHGKQNTTPGKSRTIHARWVEESGEPLSASLVWSKSDGLTVVGAYEVKPTPEQSSVGMRPYLQFLYGTVKEWSDPQTWEKLKGQTQK